MADRDVAGKDRGLTRLLVRHIATIPELDLSLGSGLCVFTGETGAGKSIVLDAIGLLLGDRMRQDLLRAQETEWSVLAQWSQEEAERTGKQSGRGQAKINGRAVSVRDLGEWTRQRITVYGQGAATNLLTPAFQRELLDRHLPEKAHYDAAYDAWRSEKLAYEHLEKTARERAKTLELLRFQVDELEAAQLIDGEEELAGAELLRLTHAQTIAQAATDAGALLTEGEWNVTELLGKAIRVLSAGAKYDERSRELVEELRELTREVTRLSSELEDVVAAADTAEQTARMDELETRLALLGRLRKYGATVSQMQQFLIKARAEKETLEAEEGRHEGAEERLLALRETVQQAGKELDLARVQRAEALSTQIVAVVQQLGMPHARLAFVLHPYQTPTAGGLSEVELLFNANPGEELGALAAVASGGELSRVMLAVMTVLGGADCMIFDEVDAGIGGTAALAVAAQLKTLAQERQVLAVTHLAQIAAKADHHFKIEKEVSNGRTISQVRRLEGHERTEEIARMLSGNTSEAALEHARELMTNERYHCS